jgi:hypothetical protein
VKGLGQPGEKAFAWGDRPRRGGRSSHDVYMSWLLLPVNPHPSRR